MTKVNIKKNDQVLITTGKDRGATGRVLKVLPAEGRVIVEGVNMIKRHTRPNPQKQVQGGVVEREAPLHISNVKLLDPETKQPTRVGRRKTDDGKSMRYAKSSGANLD